MKNKIQTYLKEAYWRAWYSYVNKKDRNNELTFMNYGFQGDKKLDCFPKEKDRYSIQLYDFIINSIPEGITNKSVLEVGCGRGGGALFLTRSYNPGSFLGVDICNEAINFCKVNNHDPKLSFMQGDAQNLPLKDNSMDIAINIESSHRYPDVTKFFKEINRVLKSKGYFSFTDFRAKNKVVSLIESLSSSGMVLLESKVITPQVLMALDADNERKLDLISRLVPKVFHKQAREFASVKESASYESLASGRREYLYFLLQNPVKS